jgi:hypothetical protein
MARRNRHPVRGSQLSRAVLATGVCTLIAPLPTALADLEFSVSPAIVNAPWDGLTPPKVDTIDVVPGIVDDSPGNFLSTVPERFQVTAQTFKVTEAFKLGKIDIVGSIGPNTGFSLHLYDLGDLGGNPVPNPYNISTANGGNPTPDLFGNGAGLAFNSNGSARNQLTWGFTGSDQVNLIANHTYAFETWRNANQNDAEVFYWERFGGAPGGTGATSLPGSSWPGGGNPYTVGDSYNAISGTATTIARNQINGAGRDLMLAVFDTSALPAMQVDINGGSPTNDLRPNQDDPARPNPHGPQWRNWTNIPTSGNGGSGPQNGYGTIDTITRTFAVSGIPNSQLGGLKTTIRSADIGDTGGGTPGYIADGPLLN